MGKGGWQEVKDGEWIRVTTKGHKNACCDCGLVHVIDYRLAEDGAFEIRFTQDGRATAAVRRRINLADFLMGKEKK